MNVAEISLLATLALCGIGAALCRFAPERMTGRILGSIGTLSAAGALATAAAVLLQHQPLAIPLWPLPALGEMRLRLDRVSALFLLSVGISFLPAYWFSPGYMRRYAGHSSVRTFGSLFHLLLAASALVLAAGDVITFLLAWRIMSLVATFAITLEHRREDTSRAGYMFLAMNEAGIIAATVGLLLLVAFSGGHIGFLGLRAGLLHVPSAWRWAIFLILFFGFSVKAGVLPMSSWLPRAHPVAPANLSAVLSGCILNFGIYGITRFVAILLPPISPGPGLIVLAVGAVSALVGILYATIDNDIKKILAHSSVENLGIVLADLGMAMVFTSYRLPSLAAIAYVVAMYHMINHSTYKTLLFLGAGAVDQYAGTRDMDRLGGLLKRMPVTALLFLVGALAISAMPPLNGFVSEWLTLQSILRNEELVSRASRVIFALCGAGLGLTAALAVTCFVKMFAMSFLGTPRNEGVAQAHEPVLSMRIALAIPAVLCLLLGVAPTRVIPGIDRAMHPLTRGLASDALVPPFFTLSRGNPQFSQSFLNDFHNIGATVGRDIVSARSLVVLHQGGATNPVVYAMSTAYMLVVLALIMFLTWILVRWGTRRRKTTTLEPWAGGLRRLSSDMTYTATGFSNPVRVIFNTILGPAVREDSSTAIEGHFRTAIRQRRDELYVVDRFFLRPIVGVTRALANLLAKIHAAGVVNTYAAWVFVSLLVLLLVNRLW